MKRFLQPSLPVAILRMLMGIIFMAHAIARLADYTIPGFGDFLNSKGFPFGFYLAWAVTLFDWREVFVCSLVISPGSFVSGKLLSCLPGSFLCIGKTVGLLLVKRWAE